MHLQPLFNASAQARRQAGVSAACLGAALALLAMPGAAYAANAAPVARLSALQAKGTYDLAFDAAKSTDADGRIVSYAWDFGDGAGATGPTASHSYAKPGAYKPRLTVTDNAGATASTSANLTVNALPVPVHQWSVFEDLPTIIVFAAGESYDPDGHVASYSWKFGDGKSGSGQDTSHQYAKPGDYLVSLTIKDNFGHSVTSSFTVKVPGRVNAEPVARATATQTSGSLTVAFDGGASSDPDGSIASYSWNFGNGKTGSGARVSHTYTAAGTYAATLTVKDNEGATNQIPVPVTVSVANKPPAASATATQAAGSLEVRFDASASKDPDGSIASYAWNFGDNTSGSGVSPSHTYAKAGQYNVSLTVTDNAGASTAFSLQVAVSAGGPTGATPWVTGYYAGWYWEGYHPDKIDMSSMTHIVFGRIAPGGGPSMKGNPGQVMKAAGSAHLPGQLPANVTSKSVEDYLVERAHAAGIKALVMLGGDDDGPGFVASTESGVRATFIKNLLDYLVAHDYDGVDVDWEDGLNAAQAQGQLIPFLKELRAASAQRARYANRPLLVTFPTFTLNMNTDSVPAWKVEIAKLVDQFNLMSYEMAFTGGGGWDLWQFAPIEGQAPTHPSDISSSVQAYVNAGVARSKIGIGIGFYGLSCTPPASHPGQALEGFDCGSNDTEWSYANLVNGGFLSAGTYTWDPLTRMGYRTYEGGFTGHAAGNWSTSGYLTYEDPASIAAKGKWVRETGVGGTILWTINYGTPDGVNNPLLNAVKQSFILGSGNPPPNARMSSKIESDTALRFMFDGSSSTDSENKPVVSYAWDFGDGETALGSSARHTYAKEGVYRVILTVTDAKGVSDTFITSLHATFPPPPDVLPPLEVIPPSTSAKPWVMGYYAGWSWDVSQHPSTIDYTAMTHLVFGRVAPGGGSLPGGVAGEVIKGGGTSHDPGLIEGKSVEDYMIGRAHAVGTKAILMLGGMGDGAGFYGSTDPRVRPTFVKNLLDYLEQHSYDGIDVDWEDVLDSETARFRLTALIAELRAGAKKRARWQDGSFLITFPGYALNMNFNKVDPWKVTIASIVDQYNLMSYGMGYSAEGWHSTTFAPLTGLSANKPMDISSSIQAYVDKGVPRKKLGLGIGFYGMCYALPVTAVNQPASDVDSDDNTWNYHKLFTRGYLSNGTYHWDETAQMAYRSYAGGYEGGGAKRCGMISYEDPRSIAAKGAWVRNPDTAIGGAIIWLVNFGTTNGSDNPLLDAVKKSFLAPPSAQ